MKRLTFAIAILLAFSLFAGMAYAETGRLGENTISFNPSRVVTKTAAYTITTSDSQINVNATGAAYTMTLPSVSDCMTGMTCIYKIKKTDSSVNAVTVSPATGDTIGGESARVLVNQNAYMVIQAGPGRDWTVNYESPYVVEDHEAGTSDLGTQGYDASIVFEGATANAYETTLAVTDPTADITYQLPDAVAGTYYVMVSSLATNQVDKANSVWGASNGLVMEGATADAYETTITPADPTADRTVTLADASGTVMLSALATNAADAANSVTGVSNGLIFEGATADDYEITLSPVDATADTTATIPNATGTLAMTAGVGSYAVYSAPTVSTTFTTADCGKIIGVGTDALTHVLPDSTAGCLIRFVNTGAAGNNDIKIDVDANDQIFGTVTLAASVVAIAGSAGDSITNTKGTSIKGDSIGLLGIGSNTWIIVYSTGIWADTN